MKYHPLLNQNIYYEGMFRDIITVLRNKKRRNLSMTDVRLLTISERMSVPQFYFNERACTIKDNKIIFIFHVKMIGEGVYNPSYKAVYDIENDSFLNFNINKLTAREKQSRKYEFDCFLNEFPDSLKTRMYNHIKHQS